MNFRELSSNLIEKGETCTIAATSGRAAAGVVRKSSAPFSYFVYANKRISRTHAFVRSLASHTEKMDRGMQNV